MSFGSSTNWQINTGGSDSANGGGFDTGATFVTDLTATVANTSAPIVSSASYNFISRDVGAWLFIALGSNWIPGWYQIASVATNKATLTASIGSAVLWSGAHNSSALETSPQTKGVSTVTGCATTASPSGGTWSIDYSWSTSPAISYTDMVIGATTTQFTSIGNPVGPNLIGNIISVTSGSGFTVQRVEVTAFTLSGLIATCDKSLGTAASTGGNGGLGGALATLAKLVSLMVSYNTACVASGTYTLTTSLTGALTNNWIAGYGSLPGDLGTKPLITTATNSTDISLLDGSFNGFQNFAFTNTAGTRGRCFYQSAGNALNWRITGCSFSGFTYAIYGDNGTPSVWSGIIDGCEFSNGSGTTAYVRIGNDPSLIIGNYFTGCGGPAIFYSNSQTTISIIRNTFYENAVDIQNNVGGTSTNLGVVILGNTFRSPGSVSIVDTSGSNLLIINNIFDSPTTYAINVGAATIPAPSMIVNNAFYLGSGTANYQFPVPSVGDIILSGSPLNNPSGGDFSLNNTSGAGALVRGAAYPSTFPGISTNNYLDVGAVQHQATGSSGGPVGSNMHGGFCN